MHAEDVDSTNPKWSGQSWKANDLQIPSLLHQAALFPIITRGSGEIYLPKDQAYVLRLALISTNNEPEQIAKLWGRVSEHKDVVLATLWKKGSNYVWICPVNAKGDSLFDAPGNVTLPSYRCEPNNWVVLDTILNPNAYQQLFGWNSANAHSVDPALAAQSGPLARQLSPAEWHISRLEILPLHSTSIGLISLLPQDTTPVLSGPNIGVNK